MERKKEKRQKGRMDGWKERKKERNEGGRERGKKNIVKDNMVNTQRKRNRSVCSR